MAVRQIIARTGDEHVAGHLRGDLSASRRILTICSSENLVFFMVPSVPEGPLSQSINWTENRPAGQIGYQEQAGARVKREIKTGD
jgi:hypothetical protein